MIGFPATKAAAMSDTTNSVSTNAMVPMPEGSAGTEPVTPADVTFVKLRLRGNDSGTIDISYSEIAHQTSDGAATIQSTVDQVLRGEAEPSWHAPVMTSPSPSRLSLRNDVARFFVFLLESGNYRFAAGDYPFRVEDGKQAYFRQARCVWPEGEGFSHGRLPPVGAVSKAAYFLADSDRDLEASGGLAFRSKFNIYLNLDYPEGAPIPICIDPDVGYPGGHS